MKSHSPASTVLTATNIDNNVDTVASSSPPQSEVPPAQADPLDAKNLQSQYGALLSQAIAKYKKYPAFAKLAKQQGVVILQLQINYQGHLLGVQIAHSSGFELLDNQAVEMVKKATPFSQPPSHLVENDVSLLVPVSFRLN